MDGQHEQQTPVIPTGTDTNSGIAVVRSDQNSGDVKNAKPPEKETEEYRLTKKFEDWVEYFLDRSNKQTYGNRTQSAIKAYDLDPIKQYHTAGQIGMENYKKLGGLGAMYLESRGLTAGGMLDIAVAKLAKTTDTEKGGQWWDRIAEVAGLKGNTAPQAQAQQTQINVFNLGSPEVSEFNQKFERFLETQ